METQVNIVVQFIIEHGTAEYRHILHSVPSIFIMNFLKK
jgi:hypothetical protein